MEGQSGNWSSVRTSEMLKEKLEPFAIIGFLDRG